MLLDPRSLDRPYIERKRLEEVVRGHLKGDRNYTDEIHKVLTLEIIHRLFIDKSNRRLSASVWICQPPLLQLIEPRLQGSSVVPGDFPHFVR